MIYTEFANYFAKLDQNKIEINTKIDLFVSSLTLLYV